MYTTTSTPNRLYNSTRYPLRSRRGSLHSLDCSPSRKNLEAYTRSELLELKERNERMLRHRAVIHTLPDKGAKLKQSIRQIDVLLLSPELLEDDITVENTFADRESALTSKLAGLSFLTPRQEARKRGIAMANARAQQQPYTFRRRNSSSVLMRRPSSYLVDEAELPSKVCMMSLEESVKLQEHHQRLVEESNRMLPPPPMPVSLDDSLSMTMSRMQLTNNQPPPMMLNRIEDEEEDDYVVPQGVYFDGMKKVGSEDQTMMSSDEEDDYSRDYYDHDDDDDDDEQGQ